MTLVALRPCRLTQNCMAFELRLATSGVARLVHPTHHPSPTPAQAMVTVSGVAMALCLPQSTPTLTMVSPPVKVKLPSFKALKLLLETSEVAKAVHL